MIVHLSLKEVIYDLHMHYVLNNILFFLTVDYTEVWRVFDNILRISVQIFFGQNAVCEECADICQNELKSIKVGATLAILKRWPAITESLV
jgi:hypothetical protein